LAARMNPSISPLTFNPTPGSQRWTLGYTAGSTLPNAALNAGLLRPLRPLMDNLGNNHMRAGLMGAGLGAAAGAVTSTVAGGDPTRGAAVGAGLGGVGSLLLSMYARRKMLNAPYFQEPLPEVPHQKSAFYGVMSQDGSDIEDRVMADNSLNYMDKTTLLRFVNGLNPERKSSLSRFIGPMAGAGVGIAVARFLLKLGIGGTALLAIVGATLGHNLTSGQSNAFGQRVSPMTDMFGQPRYV